MKRNNNEVSLLCEMTLLDEGEIQDGEGEEERENPEREKKERKTLGARVRCEIGNGEEEEESGSEGVVLLLRSWIRGREDTGTAPEGQALQMPCLSQEALHRRWHGHPRPPGPQRDRFQVLSQTFLLPKLYICIPLVLVMVDLGICGFRGLWAGLLMVGLGICDLLALFLFLFRRMFFSPTRWLCWGIFVWISLDCTEKYPWRLVELGKFFLGTIFCWNEQHFKHMIR